MGGVVRHVALRLLLVACVLGALAHARITRAAPPPLVIVGAPDLPVRKVTRAEAAAIFLRRQVVWRNGERVRPVNLPPAHAARRLFMQEVLGQTSDDAETYWREMYFNGVLPPRVLGSEDAVLLFVAKTPGAIGYVVGCPQDRRVLVLLTVGDPGACSR